MARLNMTVDDWVITLDHAYFPTVVVEGEADRQIYDWVEKSVGSQSVDVLSVGGRETLLAVYKSRSYALGQAIGYNINYEPT